MHCAVFVQILLMSVSIYINSDIVIYLGHNDITMSQLYNRPNRVMR